MESKEMKEMYKRVFLVDTENQGTLYLKDLDSLKETDLLVCISTEYSPKFTYTQLESFLNCRARFQFVSCQAGTPNALDFQLSTLLGYMLKQDEVDETNTEFIILSHDTGYYGIVSYWKSRGFNVGIRSELNSECVDVQKVLSDLGLVRQEAARKVAAHKAEISGATNSATEGKPYAGASAAKKKEVGSQIAQATSSAIDRFNKRLEVTKQLKEETKVKEKDKKKSDETAVKPNERTIKLEDLDLREEDNVKVLDKSDVNEDLVLLSAGNNGKIYNNIRVKYMRTPDIFEKIEKNAMKVAKFTKLNIVESLIAGYVVYVAKDSEEIKRSLLKVLNGDSKTLTLNTIVKRVEQKHFYNKYIV